MQTIDFSITDLVEIIKKRQENKFDANIAVTGARGNSKSTFLFKLFCRFDNFDPWKHQVYCRKDVIQLLESEKLGIIFDDEAIQSSYKRDFQSKEQQNLIKMLTMYRDNFNVYGCAIPYFYSLDKDLRNLIKIHINMISRGIGVLHVAHDGVLYSDDPWNVAYNKKIEEAWIKRRMLNPDFKIPYHKLTTFKGFIYFNDITPQQRELYEEVKKTKRKELYEKDTETEQSKNVNEAKNIFVMFKNGKFKNMEDLKKYIFNVSEMKNIPFGNLLNKVKKEASNEGRTLSNIEKELKQKYNTNYMLQQTNPNIPQV